MFRYDFFEDFFLFTIKMLNTALCADKLVGRATAAMFSDQTLMELLIDPSHSSFRDVNMTKDGDFKDKCEWEGVVCSEFGEVTEIQWGRKDWVKKELNLDKLPRNLIKFAISNFGPSTPSVGTVTVATLPPNLEMLQLRDNAFHGEFDFEALPRSMINVNLFRNDFHGSANLAALPPALQRLNLMRNKVAGSADLCYLPQAIVMLCLTENEFFGTIDLGALPDSLCYLYLDENAFEGSVLLDSLPAGLVDLDLRRNRLSGTIRVEFLPKEMYSFDVTGNAEFTYIGPEEVPEWIQR